ncbi:MAG: CapA family protein [Firmicutes bacterium]|nr:CapA family protein [Bacillota bacterium]
MREPITIALTGDLMLERPITPAGGGRSPGSAAVWEVFHRADLVFVNLEVPLTARGAPADKHVAFRADPPLAGELRAAGIDVVTLANNHMLDYGPEGLFDTLEALHRVGLPAVGAGRTLAEALAPAVLTARGVRVAFLGLASTLPVGSAAAPDRPGIAPVHVTTLYVVDSAGLDETPGKAPYVETRCWPGDVEAAAEATAQAAPGSIAGAALAGAVGGGVAQYARSIVSAHRTITPERPGGPVLPAAREDEAEPPTYLESIDEESELVGKLPLVTPAVIGE